MHRAAVSLLALAMTGCPICPDGELALTDAPGAARTDALEPGEFVQLTFRYGGDVYSRPDACGGHWFVDGLEGGSPELGEVTPCGLYTAPEARAPAAEGEPRTVEISASVYPIDQCHDCCPYARRTFTLVPAP